jgi:hypothetical protein
MDGGGSGVVDGTEAGEDVGDGGDDEREEPPVPPFVMGSPR